MVDELVAAGCTPAVAARIVAEAFTAGVLSAPVRGIPVDTTAEKRRAYDRERKAKGRNNPPTSGGIPVDSAECPKPALSLSNINKKERSRKCPCPPEWKPTEKHFTWAEREGIPKSAVLEKAEDLRLWAQSTGEQKKDWDATLFVWLRRDAPKIRVGSPAPVPGNTLVFVKEGTEAWAAWQAIKKTPVKNEGWYFESEYPPNYEPKAA
jgi:hypothetical protein